MIDCRKLLPKEGGRKLKLRLEQTYQLQVGRDRLFSLLRSRNLLVQKRRSYTKTTDSKHGWKIYPNYYKSMQLTAPNQAWVCDITYIGTREGFCYLALITDAYSRCIVGYDISESLGVESSLRALKMALKQLPPGHQLVHHSDRGIQYCCSAYTNLLRENGIVSSMAAKGDCYENAIAERVNGILKEEFALNTIFSSRKPAYKAAMNGIELYNNYRYHSSIAMKTPKSVHQQ